MVESDSIVLRFLGTKLNITTKVLPSSIAAQQVWFKIGDTERSLVSVSDSGDTDVSHSEVLLTFMLDLYLDAQGYN